MSLFAFQEQGKNARISSSTVDVGGGKTVVHVGG
jgi:hypothetical protein